MSLFGLPPLRPNFGAAIRDIRAKAPAMRVQAAERLGDANDEERTQAVNALRLMLVDVDPRVRAAAVAACGRLESADLCDDVIDAVDDIDPVVREVAIVALARIGGDKAAKAVREALESEHPETRFQAALSYAELCPDDAAPLSVLIHDEDPMVRINATQALAASTDPHAESLLRECLLDHNPQVRRRAAITLAAHGDRRGVRDVMAALNDNELVLEALDALGALGDPEAIETIRYKSAGLLESLLVKAAAGGALARLGDPHGVEVLRQVLRAWRSEGRNLAVEIVGELRLNALLPELLALVSRPRGTHPQTLAAALERFAVDHSEAKNALDRLNKFLGAEAEIVENTPAGPTKQH